MYGISLENAYRYHCFLIPPKRAVEGGSLLWAFKYSLRSALYISTITFEEG